jgi:hypothetical protein
MGDHDTYSAAADGAMIAVDRPTWRYIAVQASGYVFLIWAAIVAFNVFAFGDPVAGAAAADGVSHIPQILTHVPRNALLVLALFVTLGAAIAPGDALLRAFRIPARDAFDRIAFGIAAGLVVLTAAAYALAAVQLLRWQVEAPLLLVSAALSARSIRAWIRDMPRVPDTVRVPRALNIIMWVLLGATMYVSLLAALVPEVGFDARYYHLAEAHRYAQHGGFYDLVAAERTWPYAMPHYQETLYAFVWVLFGALAAKVVAWGGAAVSVLALIAFSRTWFSSTAVGVLASLILFTTPVLAWSATTATNDLASVPFVLLALHALLVWRGGGSPAALYAAGLLAGMTYGIKPFGAFTVIAVGTVAAWTLRARGTPRPAALRTLGVYGLCALLGLLPAMVSAAWMSGDPLYPLFAGIFPSRYGSGALGEHMSQVGSALLQHLSPLYIASLPWSITTDPVSYRGLPGPVWLVMLPVWLAAVFFARRFADVVRPLAAFAAVFTAIMFVAGAIELRFIAPALAVVALLIAYCATCLDWSGARALQTTIFGSLLVFAVLGNPLVARLHRGSDSTSAMGVPYLNWPYIYEGLPDSAVQLQYVPVLVYANAHLDPLHDKIYDGVSLQLMNAYSEIPLFNGTASQSPAALHEWSLASPDAYERLRAEGCTYVIVAKSDLKALTSARVLRHLRLVLEARTAYRGPNDPDELFKVVD